MSRPLFGFGVERIGLRVNDLKLVKKIVTLLGSNLRKVNDIIFNVYRKTGVIALLIFLFSKGRGFHRMQND